ncbi:MAG: FHA domain-containing protein [Herpetosiphonaceae bacterium]|nr:FHA domain-containing protein [Herpetosiphonaceae bacterium]
MTRKRPGSLLVERANGMQDEIALHEPVTTLGRSASCTIAVDLPNVSRLHAVIELQHDRYILIDKGSVNGTLVNGNRLTQEYQLNTGDVISLGSPAATLVFSDPEATLIMPIDTSPPPLLINAHARMVMVYGTIVPLSPLEYSLLLYLANHAGQVCTREVCFLAVWNQPYDHATCEDALNACVTKLRRNLRATAHASGQEPPLMTTVHRIGFRLDAPVVWDADLRS